MGQLTHAQSCRDLIIYQKSRQLAREIFNVTKTFPKEETYALTDQIRRSSRSIGAQIAEAWAKRRYDKHFVSKLTDADGELPKTIREAATDYFISSDQEVVNSDQYSAQGELITEN